MKRLMLIISATVLLAATAKAEIRTWMAKNGNTTHAEFVKEKFNTVHPKAAAGSIKQIKKANLSKQDQHLVDQLTDPFAAKKAASAAAEVAKPTAPDALYDLFGDELRNSRKKKVSIDELAGKTIGIYFSAHWCPPCRAFTPVLVEFHQEMTRKEKPFEIVFVSSDREKSAMYSYMREMDMPWLALEFGDDHKGALASRYHVRGIPKLVIIDPNGNLITENGRDDVAQRGARAYNEWQ